MKHALLQSLIICLMLTGHIGADAPDSAGEAPTELTIVESPIAVDCYTKSEGAREIDTVVVHFASAINWFDASFQKMLRTEAQAYADGIGLTRENLAEHKYDWQLVKAIFETYRVSSHYAIARDGTIARFVADTDVAYHAGKSTMPNDGREKVNGFSIGIELMASHPSDDPTVTAENAYTDAQYEALNKLIAQLNAAHGIDNVVGHDEIAPGRKNDPGPLFQWNRVRTADYKPLACP